ncbi:hypothetical protein ACFTQ7_06760 [Lysinibacillus sp. NPDC056959]|uniref:hypothetical protein n=1 Tax=Lysinibacillus sp. NPDC056959 TaxID=3345981 RepID=UPI0036398FD0
MDERVQAKEKRAEVTDREQGGSSDAPYERPTRNGNQPRVIMMISNFSNQIEVDKKGVKECLGY